MSASPLAGLRVLDLSRHLPGHLAAHLLADLGARVIKVEEPEQGDPIRHVLPGPQGKSALAAILLSGVESVALDLKRPAAREILERLLAVSDVLIESFRPGTMARLGLDPEELRQRHPRLVLCSISGWGQTGPYARRAGHDLNYQAVAGLLAAAPRPPAVQVADLAGAWAAVAAILAALHERERTGTGTRVDAGLFDAAAHANLTAWAAEAERPRRVEELLPLTGAFPCYGVYRTADRGWLAVGALEPHFWSRLCEAVEKPGLASLQFADSRRARRKVEDLIASRTGAEWQSLAAEHDLPLEPVLAAAEARQHPQALDRAVVSEGEDGLPRIAFPARLDGHRPSAGPRVPALGEHTEAVLEELGGPPLTRRERREAGIGRRLTWKGKLLRLLWRR